MMIRGTILFLTTFDTILDVYDTVTSKTAALFQKISFKPKTELKRSRTVYELVNN